LNSKTEPRSGKAGGYKVGHQPPPGGEPNILLETGKGGERGKARRERVLRRQTGTWNVGKLKRRRDVTERGKS